MATPIDSIDTTAPIRAWNRAQSQVTCLSPYYLVPITLGFLVVIYLKCLWVGDVLIKDHPLILIASFLGAAVFGLGWLYYVKRVPADSLLTILLLSNVVAWLVVAARVWRDGDRFNSGAWLATSIFLLILMEPPSLKSVYLAADTFALGLLLIAVLGHLFLRLTGVLVFPADETDSRLPTVFDVFGFEQRWPGTFTNISNAGPVGGLLLMYGLLRTGSLRLILAVGGLLILTASAPYTAGLAVLFGLIVAAYRRDASSDTHPAQSLRSQLFPRTGTRNP